MKVKVNEEQIFELEQWEKDVIANDIASEDLDADLKRRLEWVLKHKVEQCYNRFEKEWLEKLRNDPSVESIPKTKKGFVEMVIARPDYKNRSQKRVEEVVQ